MNYDILVGLQLRDKVTVLISNEAKSGKSLITSVYPTDGMASSKDYVWSIKEVV